jgi:hypothetical protein
MAHTPGKWVVSSGMVETENGIPIAKMDRETGNGTLPVERDDNARLIAAAPEMEEALTRWIELVNNLSFLSEESRNLINIEKDKVETILKKIKGA